jgi:transposase-like protein
VAYPKKITASREELFDMYINQCMTLKDIAKKYGVHVSSVSERLISDNIPRRKRSAIFKKDILEDLYINKHLTMSKIAKQLGYSASTIFVHLNKLGIPIRNHEDAALFGENHPNWKGGFKTTNGYLATSFKGKVNYVHRLVMENKLGRKLQPNEIVHHINENKLDNRPENLMLVEKNKHMSMSHHRTKKWQELKNEWSNYLKENQKLKAKIEELKMEIKLLKENI